ncbi:MAG: YeeE/YedE family protein [Desulfotignum sp.]|nr:YeeE/YedE family protein [Desulfotignum sp.]
MIETFLSLGQLNTANALFVSVVIGIFFGIALEQAGFGSSRRLAGVFYFRDMAVIKVMFTAMITAIICLQLSFRFGLISEQAVYLNPTLYKAQVIGGIIFGIGFVMGGWCPGTAAVGAASGKWDAFIFLFGAAAGSALFNETYPLIQGLQADQLQHIAFVHETLGIGREWLLLFFVAAGVLVFWIMELIEKKTTQHSAYLGSSFLKQFSMVFLVAGFFVFLVSGTFPDTENSPEAGVVDTQTEAFVSEQTLLAGVDEALDHMEPEDLANRIYSGHKDILLVDIRPRAEFLHFHIKTARNIELKELFETLLPYKNKGMIVLYSNGMTHPAQARDALSRVGFQNVYLLTDGLEGFIERCLKPVSLRSEPIPESQAAQINQWRRFFLGDAPQASQAHTSGDSSAALPEWPLHGI